MRRLSVVALAAALVLAISSLAPSPALAADDPTPEQIEQAKVHFGKGRELYEAGDKKGAVEEFKAAYRLSKNALLLYNVGLVYDELGEKRLAVQYYQKFIIDAPDNDKTRDNKKLARERLKLLEAELEKEDASPKKEEPKVEPKKEEPKKKPGVTEFSHLVLDEAPPGKPIDLTARIPDGADWRLVLYYRPMGQEDFVAVKMKPRYAELVGRIPEDATRVVSIQYYIEVKDKNGKLVAQTGSAASPNIIYMEKRAKSHYYQDLEEGGSGEMVADRDGEEKPVEEETTAGGAAIDDEDPLAIKPKRGNPDDDELFGGGAGGGKRDVGGTNYVKWGVTGGAAALLGTGVVLLMSSARYSAALEDEAAAAKDCPGGTAPPCIQYGDYQRDLEKTGKSYELWGNVTLGIGAGAAVVAGYLWWKDMKKPKKGKAKGNSGDEARRGLRLSGVPMVTPDGFGGAALLEF